jgi:hypothetical protein
MNRLITLLTIIMTVVLMTPTAWAGAAEARADQNVSYQNLSPAEFFGYTALDKTAASDAAGATRGAYEKRASVLKDTKTSYNELSPVQFFGYAKLNPVTAMAVMNDKVQIEKEVTKCDCDKMIELKSSRSIYHELSPAEFFYGYPQSDTKVNRCTHC